MCAPELESKLAIGRTDHGESKTDASTVEKAPDAGGRDLKNGVRLGTASLAFLFVAITVTMPHVQSQRDSLGCDSMCVGSMTSVRSMLSLAGATLVGKLSDAKGLQHFGGARRICLLIGVAASMATLLIGYNASNIQMRWASMIPSALLQHNADIFKAMFSSYHDAVPEKSSSTDRAASAGLLGMAVGLALMAGPLAGVTSSQHTSKQPILVLVVCL